MRFYKKVLVLKEITKGFSVSDKPVGGIVRAETENGVGSVNFSFVNFRASARGGYALFLYYGEGKLLYFDLGARPTSYSGVLEIVPDFSHGFAAGVCHISDDLPTLAAFQRTEESDCTVTDFKRAVAERCLNARKNRIKAEKEEQEAQIFVGGKEDAAEEIVAETAANTCDFTQYDDEAVATENYFDKEKEVREKNDDENVRFENELSYIGNEEEAAATESGAARAEDEERAGFGDKLSQHTENGFGNFADGVTEEKYSDDNPYFLTVKSELDGVFEKFPEEDSLIKLFPDSRFSRINYSEDKFYVVGVIKERGEEKYICYGVPGAYSENAPEELAPYCSFIPLSVFDLSGDGYWMMFQSATTGECIHLNNR